MTQNEGQNFGSSSRALGAFDQRGPYGILIHLGVDFLKMNESQFRAENPAAKYPLPYRQKLLSSKNVIFRFINIFENFQNGLGTQIFWFLETSMEVEYRIPKSTNLSEIYNFRNFFEKLDFLIFTIFSQPY